MARRGPPWVGAENERSGKFPFALVAPQARHRQRECATGQACRHRTGQAGGTGPGCDACRCRDNARRGECAGIRPDASCRRSTRSAPIPTSVPFCSPACRRRSSMRHFVAPGRPIPPFATTLDRRNTRGISPIPRQCRVSATSVRTSTSRSSSPRFSAAWRRKANRRRMRPLPRRLRRRRRGCRINQTPLLTFRRQTNRRRRNRNSSQRRRNQTNWCSTEEILRRKKTSRRQSLPQQRRGAMAARCRNKLPED